MSVTWEGGGARATVADDGTYTVCGIPARVPISIVASADDAVGDGVSITLPSIGRYELDLTVTRARRATDAAEGSGRRIDGRVTAQDAAGGLAGASVWLSVDGVGTTTGPDGSFSLRSRSDGTDTLKVRLLGYEELWTPVDLAVHERVIVMAELTRNPIELEPIVVTTTRNLRLERQGFYERKEWADKLGLGDYMTQDEIEATPVPRITDLLSRFPGLATINWCTRGQRCQKLLVSRSAGPRWARDTSGVPIAQPCPANVYLNGVLVRVFKWDPRGRLTAAESIDAFAVPSELAGIEVYRRASDLPAEFGGATDGCGAVVLWTR